ncbi:MAG: MFS transporter [Chloroflexi bacterium]|nr:MFS transporter [Chloroflexota bacterium]
MSELETAVVQIDDEARVKEFERVPFWRTIFYSFGNAAGLLTYTTFNTFIQYFYTTVMGLPPQWVGRGWFLFGFWNAVNDPVAGWLSDRTRTRWGRRRFYIGLLAIPTAIAFALVWLPPFDKGNPTAILVYFLVIISLYDMLQTIITLNQDALFPEMYQETGSRASSASVRQLIGFVAGNGLAVALTPTIYERLGWSALAVLWGSLAAVLYFVSLIGIRENPAFAQQEKTGLREQLAVVLGNRTFLIVLAINFMTRFIMAVLVAVMPFYADYVLHISGEQLTQLLLTLFIASGLSLLLWQRVIKRFGSRASMLASLLIAAGLAFFLLGADNLWQTAVILALLGIAIGGTVLGPDLLFAEVVDDDYVRTGLRREGMYRGILGFIYRFPPAVSGLILGEGLALAGFNADLDASLQPEAVSTVIRFFAAGLPLLAVLLGSLLLWAYPLYGQHLHQIQQRAAVQRQAAYQRHAQRTASGAKEQRERL